MQTAPITPDNPHRPQRKRNALAPLRRMLLDLESKLGVEGPTIYKKLGMRSSIYSTWRRGIVHRPNDPTIYERFKKAYGIDFYLSLGMGEIVIVDKELFESCVQTEQQEIFKEIPQKDAVSTITSLNIIIPRIQAALNANRPFLTKKLGVSSSTYAAYLDGTIRQPRLYTYERCKRELGIDLYLSQGKGDIVIADADIYVACVQESRTRLKPPKTEMPVFVWPFHEALQHIETFLGIDPAVIYIKLGIGKIIYQGWKAGKRRILKENICAKYRMEFGIDLYQSMIDGKIVITDQAAVERCRG
ncbi:hypothetical protein SAMN04488128_101228 [Chitinophaga eiseniae]|uniref:Uncharacterized protein n=1 Tax=Chitinophaga eiseniae TaxID=634771 RepID=A0A1T4KNR3_9BACT|nr:hypothetical protein [Chitinophaga eiseniae]SJZ44052.1 hypothetical protein SAMN04488128_101228 [Chitinophaga eiseniae]